MVGLARVWPLCLLLLNYYGQLGSAAHILERRAVTALRNPVAPPGGQSVTVIQPTVEDLTKGRKLTTYVVYETQATRDLKVDIPKNIRHDATDALNAWSRRNEDFVYRDSGTLYTSKTIRLDLQGKFDKDGIKFANLQLQINGRNVPQPSSIAQVSIEIGTTQDSPSGLEGMTNNREVYFAATALDASLRQGRKTWVFQELTDAKGKLLRRNQRG